MIVALGAMSSYKLAVVDAKLGLTGEYFFISPI